MFSVKHPNVGVTAERLALNKKAVRSDPNRDPTHRGELLREEVLPAIGEYSTNPTIQEFVDAKRGARLSVSTRVTITQAERKPVTVGLLGERRVIEPRWMEELVRMAEFIGVR